MAVVTIVPADDTGPIADAMAARALLDRLDGAARHHATPCGAGTMVWRVWGRGPVVLLAHGGAGSWRHWVRNLAALSADHTVIAPDLPGLGESERAPEPVDAATIAGIVGRGLETVVGGAVPLHIIGFSFGGVIAGVLAAAVGDRVRSLTLIGSGGLGPPNRSVELVKVRDRTGEDRIAAHRTNLARMMLADPAAIDALALEIQERNSQHARLNSGSMWISPVLHQALGRVRAPVHALWGEREMPDRALLDVRVALMRQARPDAATEIVPNAGHWAAYEAAGSVNSFLLRVLTA
ncbi:MAG TPA: alpha/beta fold hydrolase [Acetobacteraceae bacterium]|nr:alpha/beta fold hydrolase [Acetobacteraceae bacterium]